MLLEPRPRSIYLGSQLTLPTGRLINGQATLPLVLMGGAFQLVLSKGDIPGVSSHYKQF